MIIRIIGYRNLLKSKLNHFDLDNLKEITPAYADNFL